MGATDLTGGMIPGTGIMTLGMATMIPTLTTVAMAGIPGAPGMELIPPAQSKLKPLSAVPGTGVDVAGGGFTGVPSAR